MTGHRASLVAIVTLVLCRAELAAAAVLPLGGELQVNRFTLGNQRNSHVAMRGDSGFVVVWDSAGQDGFGGGIFAQRYDAAGAAQAVELQVNASTLAYQTRPAIGMAASGAFVVVWQTYGQDGYDYAIFGRRFDSSGLAQGGEFQVNGYTPHAQRYPAVAMNDSGAFVVAWQSLHDDGAYSGIFGRRFDGAGTPQSIEFQVNVYTIGSQDTPTVAIDSAGKFVVAWRSEDQDGSSGGVFARRFDASGAPLGGELQVNSYTDSAQREPAVSMSASGFVVAWNDITQEANDGIFARQFDSAGAPLLVEFQVNTVTAGRQRYPAVSMIGDGDFVVAWQGQDGGFYGVFARPFASSGAPLAVELQINAYTPNQQFHPAVDRSGASFVVTWTSYPGQDGSFSGVFGQRAVTLAVLDIDGDGVVAPLTDGLLVLRYLFGFNGSVLLGGVVGNGCTRCDDASISAYLATLI